MLIDLVYDLSVSYPYCTLPRTGDVASTGDCGQSGVATAVLVFFGFLCRFLLIPLITGTLVNTFFDTIDDIRSHIPKEEVDK
jgi:hypothetical protein